MKKLLVVFTIFTLYSCADTATEPDPNPQNTDQLMPLAVGNEWVYKKPDGTLATVRISEVRDVSWRDAITNDSTGFFKTYISNDLLADGRAVVYYNAIDGVHIGILGLDGKVVDDDHTLYKNPTEGQLQRGIIYKWNSGGSISVPAGTFTDTWKVTSTFTNTSAVTFYKTGVGRLKTVNNDGSTYELVSYKLK